LLKLAGCGYDNINNINISINTTDVIDIYTFNKNVLTIKYIYVIIQFNIKVYTFIYKFFSYSFKKFIGNLIEISVNISLGI